jgi:RNA polymerase sigma-70 factor (ECF subfamily)
MDRQSELALVARLRAGDTSAFDEVYDAWRPRIFAFLVRLARNRDVADDLLEEAWLRLVKSARRLAPDTHLGPWLFTVARNLYWSYCRSRRLEEESAATLLGLWPVPAPHPSPFDEAAAHEVDERVERALASMPASHREVRSVRERCHRELRGDHWQHTLDRLPSLSLLVAAFVPTVLTFACLAFLSEVIRRAIVLLTQARP